MPVTPPGASVVWALVAAVATDLPTKGQSGVTLLVSNLWNVGSFGAGVDPFVGWHEWVLWVL